MFTSRPTYPLRRPLKLYDPALRGEDVFALQHALNSVADSGLVADGVFGSKTSKAVKDYQLIAGVVKSNESGFGTAGQMTQTALAGTICHKVADETGIPYNALRGQGTFESGNWLGIYSELHNPGTDKESWDAGLVQENSRVYEPRRAFTPLLAVRDLAQEVDEHFRHFTIKGSSTRRLQLAQGAWNAPAYACYIAFEEGATNDWVKAHKSRELTPTQRRLLEEYMQHVSVLYT